MLRTSRNRNYSHDNYQFSTETREDQNKLKLNGKKEAVDVTSTRKTELNSNTFIHDATMGINSSMLSTSHMRKAPMWTHLTGFEKRRNARETHSTCQETIVRGRTGKDVALQNEPLDIFKITEEKYRRYPKNLLQNRSKTDSWSVTKIWVQAEHFGK